ncbi:MAG: HNH endonuclease, partial [Candidatus Accumulibacter sp.]|nr:HNH endonuclease [Accumulibacter sp.]
HIQSKARGGSNRIANLTLACDTCNQDKAARDIREFLVNDPKRVSSGCKLTQCSD